MGVVAPLERFQRHISVVGDCHVWTGTYAGTKSRRPTFRPTTRSTDPKAYAHRWIYEQTVGPIQEGMEIDHTCKNGSCVNVAHLEPVTGDENNRRARRAVCRAGLHDLSNPANVRWDSQGRRRGCAVCKKASEAAHQKRRYGGGL